MQKSGGQRTDAIPKESIVTEIVHTLADISDRYDAAFVDLWGCVHDGIAALPDAVAALRAYRGRGGKVVLVTNSPRPRAAVADQIADMGVPEDAWDTIATSGDSARTAMYAGAVGPRVWFMGEEPRDSAFFAPPALLDTPLDIARVPLADATGIVCCGPFDSLADPADNRPDFEAAIARDLPLLCANPDIIVDRGETREWCAGALAALYTEMGGRSLYFGKPHAPIYDLARRRLAGVGADPDTARILCIGDGIATDIAGAVDQGLDSLYITGGLAAADTATDIHPDREALDRPLAEAAIAPTYTIGFLR